MKTSQHLKALLAVMMLSLAVSAPARADRVLCDGNPVCIAAIMPFALAGVAIGELTKPNKDFAAEYIQAEKVDALQRLLRDKPDMLRDPATGSSLLRLAAVKGNLVMVRMLVEAGAVPATDRSSVLGAAASTEVIAYLIANGAVAAELDLASLAYHARDPHFAEMLTVLLDARGGLDPNDPGAQSLLRTAASHSRVDIVNILLQRGLDPNGGSRSVLFTVLANCVGTREVCASKGLEIARALLAKGAKANVVDPWSGRTALALAKQQEKQEFARLLEEAGAQ